MEHNFFVTEQLRKLPFFYAQNEMLASTSPLCASQVPGRLQGRRACATHSVRRAMLLAPLLLCGAARAEEVEAAAAPVAPDAAAPGGLTPVAAAKLAGVLLVADVVSAAVLGKSVLSFMKPETASAATATTEAGKRDWKENVADSLLGKTAAASPSTSAAPAMSEAQARKARVNALLARVRGGGGGELLFADVLATVDAAYVFTAKGFSAGVGTSLESGNPVGANTGAERVLSFASLHRLSKEETLALFAEHAAEVAANPGGASHKNIRAFAANGWEGVRFDGAALAKRE